MANNSKGDRPWELKPPNRKRFFTNKLFLLRIQPVLQIKVLQKVFFLFSVLYDTMKDDLSGRAVKFLHYESRVREFDSRGSQINIILLISVFINLINKK